MIKIEIMLDTLPDGRAAAGVQTSSSGDNPEAMYEFARTILVVIDELLVALHPTDRIVDETKAGDSVKAAATRFGFKGFK